MSEPPRPSADGTTNIGNPAVDALLVDYWRRADAEGRQFLPQIRHELLNGRFIKSLLGGGRPRWGHVACRVCESRDFTKAT